MSACSPPPLSLSTTSTSSNQPHLTHTMESEEKGKKEREKVEITNHLLQPEKLLPILRQLHVSDADLPPAGAPVDRHAQGVSDDLVAEAHADDAHAAAQQRLARVLGL